MSYTFTRTSELCGRCGRGYVVRNGKAGLHWCTRCGQKLDLRPYRDTPPGYGGRPRTRTPYLHVVGR